MATELPGPTENDQPTPFILENFGSLNTREKRPAIKDTEFSWIENWMPIGPGNMRTLWDFGPDIYTAFTRTIIHYYAYNIGDTAYFAVFLSDGAAVQVNIATQAITNIGPPGTFWNAALAFPPAATQWESKFLIIASKQTLNSYWIWNGTSLFGAGTVSPDITVTDGGMGYTSVPTVSIYGGSGTGATATATITTDGAVDTVSVMNPGTGYLPTDELVIGFSGGGSNDSAVVIPTVDTTSQGVFAVFVIDGGIGHTASAVVTFTGGGGGSGAEAVITGATNGVITAITVTNPGSGYNSPPVVTVSTGTGGSFAVQMQGGQITGATVLHTGNGYIGMPTVQINGDGTGATALANLAGDGVGSLTITNPGTGYTHASIQIVGQNKAASATITLMPFGMSGTTLETYQSRVWLGDITTFSETGPESTSDFSSLTGGGSAIAADSFLRREITRLVATNGYLYRFGDSSINVISNVQTQGVPASTTYSNSNVDPQVGTAWRESVQSFGRALVFANPSGVYALYGAAAEKVSDSLDGLFEAASFNTGQSGLTPTAAVATIFGRRMYLLTFTTTDPFTKTLRNIICIWDGQRWFVGSQTRNVTYLQTQEFDSQITAYGSDGTHIFPVFTTPNPALTKVFQTKLRAKPELIDFKGTWRYYILANNTGADPATITVQVDQFGGKPGSSPAAPIVFNESTGPFVDQKGTSVFGRLVGETVVVQASDLTLISSSLLVSDYSSKT